MILADYHGFVIQPQYVWLPLVAATAYLIWFIRSWMDDRPPRTFYGWVAPVVCVMTILPSLVAMASGDGLTFG